MKKVITILLAGILALGLAACGGPSSTDDMEHHTLPVTQDPNHVEESEPAPATTAEDISAEADTLVVYFSATGTTKDIAEKTASVTGADLYEIKAAQEYSEEDLNWLEGQRFAAGTSESLIETWIAGLEYSN